MTNEANAERLETIKSEWNGDDILCVDDIDWLIEQAERAQELERAIDQKALSVQTKDYIYMGPDDSVSYKLLKDNPELRKKIDENAKVYALEILKAENARLREVLEFYAGPEHYELWQERNGTPLTNEWTNDVTYDGGEQARKALEQSNAKT